jgi:hypothetical protein
VVGSATTCLAQPTAAPSQPMTPCVALGWPALVAGVPTPVKTGAAVVTLLRREESRGAAACHQQEQQAPTREALAPPSLVPTAAKKRASRHALEKPLVAELGPVPPRQEGRLGPAILHVSPRSRPPEVVPSA